MPVCTEGTSRQFERSDEMANKSRTQTVASSLDAGDKSGRREEFLAVALKLFSEREYAAVTIKAIAAEAGVNPALLYYYYKDKEDLFRATLEHAVTEAMDQYEVVASRHSDPVDLIDGWFEMHATLAPQIRRLVKILMDYSTSGSESRILDDVIAKFYDEETRILSAAIRNGQKSGVFRNINARKAAQFASTHLDGIMARSHIVPDLEIRTSINVLREVFWTYLGLSR
jgi:AcrR family transcriptional regulator